MQKSVALAGARAVAIALFSLCVANAQAAPTCYLSANRFEQPLPRARGAIAEGRVLTIVAIGSSSTAGTGATSPAATYPSRLEVFLRTRFPHNTIRVLNRGIGGEEEADMLARFERDVVAEKPDLVIWQVGSNAVMRDRSMAMEEILMNTGIRRLKETGADVLLVDLQYTRAMFGKTDTEPMLDVINFLGRGNRVGVFHRYELMKNWHDVQSLPLDAFSIADGLHMNDWGYDCFARNLAAAVADTIAPVAIAAAPNPAH